jgi:hypothetical protein
LRQAADRFRAADGQAAETPRDGERYRTAVRARLL